MLLVSEQPHGSGYPGMSAAAEAELIEGTMPLACMETKPASHPPDLDIWVTPGFHIERTRTPPGRCCYCHGCDTEHDWVEFPP